MQITEFIPYAVALALGLLVGMQRERSKNEVAGVRTFALITVLGTLAAHLSQSFGGWVLASAWLALAAMIGVGNAARVAKDESTPGITTELAALVMFGVGAALQIGFTPLALAVGGLVTVLLYWKGPLHKAVERIGDREFRAVMNVTLLALVILPVLPNRHYGPFQVLNPFEIWLMVVLIVGISVAAYMAYRLLGARTGTLLTGALGGLISSTATTVSYARRSRDSDSSAKVAAAVIMIASTVVFGRVLFEVALVAPDVFPHVAGPLAAMIAIMALITSPLLFRLRRQAGQSAEQEGDPAQIGTAIIFGFLYALILLAVAASKTYFGEGALYVVAGISGLTDMDAITLSTAQMVKAGRVEASTGWRVILVASMANLLFKFGAVAALSKARLRRRIALLFGLALVGGALLIVLWPS
ncbi:MAG TPA: MgtC/SapB family protein [Acidobacteriota bacterium]|nr:MgtC/SapB family protein [Acidobacteriota bacterium]